MQNVEVIGHPIAHSRSPLIHNHWIAQHRLAANYAIRDVTPADLPAFLDEMRNTDLLGCNATIPHKQALLPLIDELSPTAQAIGAVNTVYRRDNKICGDNTDAYGFLANLDAEALDWHQNNPKTAIIGAGGATRAILYALIERGITEILLFNRTLATAERMAEEFVNNPTNQGPSGNLKSSILPLGFPEINAHLNSCEFLINASSLGMGDDSVAKTKDDLIKPFGVDLSLLPPSALVTDIVYTPLITPFLRGAQHLGLRTVDGLGMLLHQAVPGFEYWFGIRPTVDGTLRQLIEEDLGQKHG